MALAAGGKPEGVTAARAEVHQAQGMVMVDLGVDLTDALIRMRAHAFARGIPLVELAREILAGLRLAPSGEGEAT